MRHNFVVNQKITQFLSEDYRKAVEDLINAGTKDDELFSFKKETSDHTYFLIRSTSEDLHLTARQEYLDKVLMYSGEVHLRSLDSDEKEIIFTYWELIPKKVTNLFNEAGKNKIILV